MEECMKSVLLNVDCDLFISLFSFCISEPTVIYDELIAKDALESAG